MSHSYEMTIMVTEHQDAKFEAIRDAVAGLGYDTDPDHIGSQILFPSETINITAGHDDEAVAADVTRAIWKANGAWCRVDVGMRDLDADVPNYVLDPSVYDDMILAEKRPDLFKKET